MNRLLLSSMILAASWPAWASAQSEIIDKANMFSADAIRSAETAFKSFYDRTKAEIVVETVPSLADVKAGADKLPPTEQDKILAKAAKLRAESKGVRGLYILICKDPGKLKFESSRNAIDPKDATAVANAMLESLKKNDRDGALASAASSLDRLNVKSPSKNAPPRQAREQQEGGGTVNMIWTVLLIGLGIWVVMAIIRAMSGGMGGGGGGGFFSSMLGGLFGAAAGMWMYNSFFGGNSGMDGGGGGDSGYDSGGGDFGDSGSGGGDFGGGGDWGGGGDF